MRLRQLGLMVFATYLTNGAWAAAADPDPLDRRTSTTASRTSSIPASSSSDSRSKSSVTSKSPLPDPALLDGSGQPAEKKPEYGMLGEFEMPGSEEKSDQAGGSSQQQQSQGGGQQQSDKNSQQGGGGGPQQSAQGAGGASQASSKDGAGGGSAASQSDQKGGGGGSVGQNDPGAKAEGMQSSGLSSPEGGGTAAAQGDAMPSKPGEQKIGDATMQIKTLPAGSAASVVGLQQPVGKDAPQSYDSKTPSGGKQSGGSGNKGVEKGRTMPAGL